MPLYKTLAYTNCITFVRRRLVNKICKKNVNTILIEEEISCK